MSTPDKYFGVGGSFRLDASGNRVPAESWPDDAIAASAPTNTAVASPEPSAPPEPEPAPVKTAKAAATTTTPDKE